MEKRLAHLVTGWDLDSRLVVLIWPEDIFTLLKVIEGSHEILYIVI